MACSRRWSPRWQLSATRGPRSGWASPTATELDRGKLEVDGSPAFAPVINQVAQEYMQACPQAQVTVRPVGSVKGLQDLQGRRAGAPVIAMYDGLPDQPPAAPFTGQPVGADALPFFPNVAAIPVSGIAPTRANALSGSYTFLATEHLYTGGRRPGWRPG